MVKQDTALTEFLPSIFTHAILLELFWLLFDDDCSQALHLVSLSLGQVIYFQCIQEHHGLLMPCCIVPPADIQVAEVPQEDQGWWT